MFTSVKWQSDTVVIMIMYFLFLGERAHECEYCGKRFTTKADVTRHVRIHTGAYLSDCRSWIMCCLRLSSEPIWSRCCEGYILFTPVFAGEKPHKCPYCESRFVQAGQLKRHLVTHEKYQEQLRVNGLMNQRRKQTECTKYSWMYRHIC